MTSSEPGPARSVLRGALGFALVSLAAFSVWAFGAPWLRARVGETGLYAAVALVFLALSGLVLHPLAGGSRFRFYRAFVPAFLVYAVVWSAIWFALHSRLGEWLASLAGTAAFAGIAGVALGSPRAIPRAAAVLFIAHSIGYFLGGMIYVASKDPATIDSLSGLSKSQLATLGRLGWGLLYGLGFGAGLGYAFRAFRQNTAKS